MFVGVLVDLVKQYLCGVRVWIDLDVINTDVLGVAREVSAKVNVAVDQA